MILRPASPGKEVAKPPTLVITLPSTPLGLTARSVNGRIQPRGRPTKYWFQIGKSTSYELKTTPVADLPPKIGAFYRESWNEGVNGWAADKGISTLKFQPDGGVDGGYIWYDMGTADVPSVVDSAHEDGIGANKLAQFVYTGGTPLEPPCLALGGGDPDFRGAKITCSVRGKNAVLDTAELAFWMQSTDEVATVAGEECRLSNWAYTRTRLTDGMLSPKWQQFSYVLDNDTSAWTYAGHSFNNDNAKRYFYMPLDHVLGHLNADLLHMLIFFEFGVPPTGQIHFDELEIAYRNDSVLVASNGGSLVRSPKGDPPARLTDGWRNGANRMWRSGPLTGEPLEFDYALAKPVKIDAVQIHQNPERPSREVEVLTSMDNKTFTPLVSGEIPKTATGGPNFAYLLARPPAPVLASWVKVRVKSGYQDDAWGLGEIEVFGQGAVVKTDDDWYGVTTDFDGLTPGTKYHWRLVAECDGVKVESEDATFVAPATDAPVVTTTSVSRLGGGKATLEGRMDPMGVATNYYFEYGVAPSDPNTPPPWDDPAYATKTGERYAGRELTPRTVTQTVEGLTPGTTYVARLVGVRGTVTVPDETPAKFTAK